MDNLSCEKNPGTIRLNQIGYRIDDEKTAFLTKEESAFSIYDVNDCHVYTGAVQPVKADTSGVPAIDEKSGDMLWTADFSSVRKIGTYYIKAGNEKSAAFTIGDEVYNELTKAVIKVFYYQRCGGSGLKPEYAGLLFAHKPCHTSAAKYFDENDQEYGGTIADVSGGWHDAGDYGRYITPAAKAAVDLMMAAEHYPHLSELDFGGPDNLASEIRYELEWMLKMQHPVTNGVFHKVTTKVHAPVSTQPDDDHEQLYLSPVSAQAAGSFAGAMSHASRFYGTRDPIFADRCISAAIKAWSWLTANPEVDAYKDPPFFRTGSYNDTSAFDERCWAAAELYSTTGSQEYLAFLSDNALPEPGFGWIVNGSYALTAYLMSDKVDKDSTLYKKTLDHYIASAEEICATAENDGYGTSIENYVWGSNMNVANNAMALIIANMLKPDNKYIKIAIDQFHYLMGRNANSISYVTLFGENAAKHPHQRPSIILGSSVPGMLVGGPFSRIMHLERDPAFRLFRENTPPAKCYADMYESFSSNEICVYWNSPLAYVLGYLTQHEEKAE